MQVWIALIEMSKKMSYHKIIKNTCTVVRPFIEADTYYLTNYYDNYTLRIFFERHSRTLDHWPFFLLSCELKKKHHAGLGSYMFSFISGLISGAVPWRRNLIIHSMIFYWDCTVHTSCFNKLWTSLTKQFYQSLY